MSAFRTLKGPPKRFSIIGNAMNMMSNDAKAQDACDGGQASTRRHVMPLEPKSVSGRSS